MDSTLVASFVSSALSIIIAFISLRRRSPAGAKRKRYSEPQPNNLRWVSAFFLLLFWLGASPVLISSDMPNVNIFVIIAVTLMLGLFFPIRAGIAAATVLVAHPANFFLDDIGKNLHDVMLHPAGSASTIVDAATVVRLLSLFLLNAIIVFLFCLWRGRSRFGAKSARGSGKERPLADDLDRIAVLHSRGILTDEEFEAAKRRMLKDEQ